MIIEIDRQHLREHYKGNTACLKAAQDYFEWTSDRVKKCFAFGNGTEKDLREYMRNNTKYCIFEEI